MASPSELNWMSHSIAKFPSTAATAAPGIFSIMPRARSCRPRWATGRAVNQWGAGTQISWLTKSLRLRDFEDSFSLDCRVGWKHGDADSGAGMAPLVAEGRYHQVGGAVQHFRSIQKIRGRIDETTEPDHADHLVEIAERGLDLRQQVDGATARRGIALLDGNPGAKFALGDQLAVRSDANLARHKQQVAGAHETDVIRDQAGRFMQGPALSRKLLFDCTRHGSSPFDVTSIRHFPIGSLLFRASYGYMQARA